MELCNLTWQEARAWSRKDPVVIVPVGATEQHGPQLPLKVDVGLVEYIAKEVCRKTGMLVTPALNFGYSEMWQSYPGTIGFKPATLRAALRDICESLIRGGFKKIFILNGHNPNLIHIQAVVMELLDTLADRDVQLGCGTYIFMAKEACDGIGENFSDGPHANEAETSMSLALFPEHVKMDAVQKISASSGTRCVIGIREGAFFVNRWPDADLFHGAYGDPSLATKEKGEAYLNTFVEHVARIIADFGRGLYNPDKGDGMPRTW